MFPTKRGLLFLELVQNKYRENPCKKVLYLEIDKNQKGYRIYGYCNKNR